MSKLFLDVRPENHLTREPKHDRLLGTYLGMAHIAGTGPTGRTCRECVFFGKERYNAETGQLQRVPHGFYSEKRQDERAGCLKPSYCLRPIVGKVKRMFPHSAPSCRLFEANETPPPASRTKAARDE